MLFKDRVSQQLWCLFLLLCIGRVCQGQLMCYVCENCAQVTADTPLLECNEDFFNAGGTTDSSVQTTSSTTEMTEAPTETSPTTDSTTTEESTTTTTTTTTTEMSTETDTESTTDSTTETTTTETTITEGSTEEPTEGTTEEPTEEPTTEAGPPSPPTIGPPITTTSIPTPPNPGVAPPMDDIEYLNSQNATKEQPVNKDDTDEFAIGKATTKAYKSSAEFRVRQLRSVSDVTYHCYKVYATTKNSTMVVNRGCSRVKTMESVCGQWEDQNPNEQINKCYPCTRSKCNGSSTITVSVTALIIAVVATFIHRK